MAFVPVANTLEVAVKMTHIGENVANIFHVESSVPWDVTSVEEALIQFRTWWETETRAERSSETCLVEVCGRDLTTASGVALCVPHGVVNCGSDLSEPMAGNVTLAVKEGTGLSGRSFRGRSYWVGLGENMVDGNTVLPVVVTNIIGDYNELSARMNALGHELVVVSKMSGSTCNVTTCKKIPTPRSAGITTPITGYASEGVVDSQRRRLPGRGS